MGITRICRLAALLVTGLLLSACAKMPEPSSNAAAMPTPTPEARREVAEDSIETMVQQMTLREKVGQLFMVRPDALDPEQTQQQIDDEYSSGVTEVSEPMRRMLEQYPVGGICQFGKNIEDPEQIVRFNRELQESSKIPLLIAVDEEGGTVARLANNPAFHLTQYESAAAVGETGAPENARQMGQTIGGYLKQYGFTMDFAPVADVYTNEANTVIGNRAFSHDAATVATMANAMAQGLQEEQILPVFKHFPGHGDTAEDSHSGLAYTYRTREEMAQCEWLPFLTLSQSEENLCAVMVGHIAAPALDDSDTPASLSHKIVTQLLREELLADQDVLVVTDSLAMGAITELYEPGEAAVQAVQAGCDVILMPDGLADAFDAVMTAVQDGTIPEERINESVSRILKFKQKYAGL